MSHLYGIVDCARDERLYGWVRKCRLNTCLFAGKLAPDVERGAPWLVRLDEDEEFFERWKTEGQGQAWGLLCRSDLTLLLLRKHLRNFLRVKLPDGRFVLFRWYDPRVWNAYWPTTNEDDRRQWLAGVEGYDEAWG